MAEEGMIEKIHHLGLAVNSIEEALKGYLALGLQVQGSEVVAEQGVKATFLGVGETHLELLEPTSESSPVAKFLASRGEGMHHICLSVSDIEASLAKLKQEGMRLIDEKPRIGAGGARIAFVHPASMHGVLVELHEESRCRSKEA
jgi:methylmalonyl-CoA/ethylmalonyl-CoA epimerase